MYKNVFQLFFNAIGPDSLQAAQRETDHKRRVVEEAALQAAIRAAAKVKDEVEEGAAAAMATTTSSSSSSAPGPEEEPEWIECRYNTVSTCCDCKMLLSTVF